jgi:hypothetical protein
MPIPAVAAAQRKLIVEAFNRRETPVATGPGREEEPPVQFLYREGHLVVREEYVDRVRRLLPSRSTEPTDPDRTEVNIRPRDFRPVIPGVVLLRLPGWQALEALGRVQDEFGSGVAAPDHLVSITGEAGHCPATEPVPVPVDSSPDPRFTTNGTGEGVRVVVVDTGYDVHSPDRHSWLRGVEGDPDPAIGTAVGTAPRPLGPYAGHGTFIAGVVRSVAPLADVRVRGIFDTAGAAYESDLVATLDDVLRNDVPDVISMSAGTPSWDASLPLCFQAFYEQRLSHYKGLVLVAAAGNDGSRDYFWPAAAPWAVSVGALSANWRNRAHFSNFGGWVDVYAPGEDIVNAYPSGKYTYQEPPLAGRDATFTGMARWSGTSFSTPIVAGLIAARMSGTGENGATAAAALLARARESAMPGVGAVLRPE